MDRIPAGTCFALGFPMRRLAALFAISLATSMSFAACNADDPTDIGADAGAEELPFDFETPSVEQVTPGNMSLGDTVSVFGGGFLANEYGSTKLRLRGTYTDEDGSKHDYKGEILLNVKNVSVASFVFEDLVFMPTRDKIGVFEGKATIISELKETYQKDDIENTLSSEELSVSLRVEPSLGVVQLRSVTETGCAPVTTGTIGDQQLGFSLQAIGMESATASSPIRFRISFLSPTMKVVYLKDDPYSVWPPHIPGLDPSFVAEPAVGQNRFDVELSDGNVLVLDPTWRKDKVTVSPPIQMGNESFSEVLLGRFSTGSTDGRSNATSIRVEAFHADGTVISRDVTYNINEEWEIQSYDQNMRLMERSDAVPVSGCFSGGDVGRDLTYTEGSSVNQSRSLSFRWDRNVANTLGITAGVGGLLPVQISANASTTFSETFGIDVNETVSSESHVGINFSARIIPGYYGTCYRQVDRIQREVNVTYNNACGRKGVIGQTILTDWTFGFDIATGPSCDQPSDLDQGGNYEPDGIELQ
jgi:hypothetical protein